MREFESHKQHDKTRAHTESAFRLAYLDLLGQQAMSIFLSVKNFCLLQARLAKCDSLTSPSLLEK